MVPLLLIALVFGCSTATLVNKDVSREVDLSTQIAKVKTEVTASNTGSSSVSTYTVLVDLAAKPNLAFVSVSAGGKVLALNKVSCGEYEATLASPLAPGASVSLIITTSFIHMLEPFPKAINQADNQLVRHHANAYFFSPYATTSQTSRFLLGTSKIESFSPKSPSSKDGTNIKYGPYSDVAAKTNARITLHFENNTPFLTTTQLNRWVEVSHWGNIAVEEHYEMEHSGAQLASTFSRLDFQRNPIGAPTAIKSFKTVLPASAKHVYYRDDIGNISTSNLNHMEDASELEIRPRFPLFGGWKTKYYIGYNLPSYELLSHSSNNYKLEFPFVDHTYDNMVVDNMELRVVLPEGACDVKVVLPNYKITREADEKHKTYLDTFGRPVLVFTAKRLEESHIQNIEIYYNFNSLMLLQEPFLVVTAFMVLFITVIIVVRLDFSITVDEDREARAKVSYLLEEMYSLVSNIKNSVVEEMLEALGAAKDGKDGKAFRNAKKELDAQYKQLSEELAAVSKKVVLVAPSLSDKVAEVTKREGERKVVIGGLGQLAEKILNDKISKSALNEQENLIHAKVAACQTSIDNALAAL